MQEIFSLVLTQLRDIWRFRWIALGVAWIIALVGWLYVYSLPDVYSSSARVHIDTRSAIDPLLHGMAVTPNTRQQVSLLIRTVLSRPNLEDIARETGLDLKATTPEEKQALIDGLQSRLKLRNTDSRADLYKISYTSSKPELAQSVIQQVMGIMTTSNLINSNRNDTKKAVSFLQKEVDKYKKKLTSTEHKLAQFQQSHIGLLPGTDSYVAQVQQLTASIGSIQDQLGVARDRSANIRQQMRSGGGSTSVSPADSQQVRKIDAQINARQQRLSQLLIKYTPEHPDVIDTKRQIADLEQRRSSTLDRLRANPSEIQGSTGGSSGGGNASARLNDAQATVKTLETSLKRKEAQLKKLQGNTDSMNEAQAQFTELNREYDATRKQYQRLLSRLYDAHLSTDVQSRDTSIEFRVIDPPVMPAKPSGPNRTILMAMALFGAIAAGLGFAWFLAQIRPVFTSRRDLTEATGFPVIGAVSMALSPAQRAGRRRAMLVFIFCSASLLVGYVAALMLVPIGVQWIPNIVSGQML